jgi:aminoglycoside 2'-N-acetyltransferase I
MGHGSATNGDDEADRPRVRRATTGELTAAEIAVIRVIMVEAFGNDEEERFTDDDWEHALGGLHFVLEVDGAIVTHAAVVERDIHVGGRPVRTGYVEAVATVPARQGAGFGSQLMADVNAYIRERFELGVLGTGVHLFYERSGWRRWIGPSSVRTDDGLRPTPDDDGYIMVLATPSTPHLHLTAPIDCEWRPGDVW